MNHPYSFIIRYSPPCTAATLYSIFLITQKRCLLQISPNFIHKNTIPLLLIFPFWPLKFTTPLQSVLAMAHVSWCKTIGYKLRAGARNKKLAWPIREPKSPVFVVVTCNMTQWIPSSSNPWWKKQNVRHGYWNNSCNESRKEKVRINKTQGHPCSRSSD